LVIFGFENIEKHQPIIEKGFVLIAINDVPEQSGDLRITTGRHLGG